MSFDLFLQHFADGEPAATERRPARWQSFRDQVVLGAEGGGQS